MLNHVSIRNFAIIEDLEVSFFAGMNILTGETGAGKSILIDAIALLSGERSAFEKIRNGATRAVIEGEFTLSLELAQNLKEQYGDDFIDERTLLVTRTLEQSGRSVARINGLSVPLSRIREIMPQLIDIHSQHQNLMLLDERQHAILFDRYIGPSQEEERYQEAYHRYLEAEKACLEAQKGALSDEEAELLAFQIAEIDDAHLEVGEKERLEEEKKRLLSYQHLAECGQRFLAHTDEDQGILTRLYLAKRELERSGDQSFITLSERLGSIYYEMQDIRDNVDQNLAEMADQLNRLPLMDDRIFAIRRLEKKYGTSVEELLMLSESMKEQLSRSAKHEQILQDANRHRESCRLEALEAAKAWRTLRLAKAKELEGLLDQQLHDLALENASFRLEFAFHDQLTLRGTEGVRFLLSTNKGSSHMPLHKIVSGGETSRVMLALKTVFHRLSPVETILFDEVDSGVSGRIAMQVARKMAEISQNTQVIVISHLPQVAAMAEHHFHVEKRVEGEMTKSSIRQLSSEERLEEIAKLLAGDHLGEGSLRAAAELIAEAKR